MKPSDYIKKGWCQFSSALDADGRWVKSTSPVAVRWCLLGALDAAYGYDPNHKGDVTEALMRKVTNERATVVTLINWNDSPARSQQDVITLLQSVGE